MAAEEYNNSEYKFYPNGFFKYSMSDRGGAVMFIEDIYVIPELRGTPASSIILNSFHEFLLQEKVMFLYGYVMKDSDKTKQRLETFTKWGLNITNETDTHYVVGCLVSHLRGKSV